MVAHLVIIRKKETFFYNDISANQMLLICNRNFTEELAVWGKGRGGALQ